jgi:acyl-CoA synthetase (AMP-forming)/AMP-acid ligase II
MNVTDSALIRHYTDLGWWGHTTLDDVFRLNAKINPERCALIDPPDRMTWTNGEVRRLSYRELDQMVDNFAELLQSSGVSAGDIIVTQLPNTHELVVLILAACRMGAIVSPVLVQFDNNELEQICDQLQPKLIVTTTWFKKRNLRDTLEPIAQKHGIACWLCDAPYVFSTQRSETTATFPKIDANEVTTICWTSGTEGTPKGVMRNHNQWLATGRLMAESSQLRDGDRLLNTRPLVNMAAFGGSFCSWLICAGTLVMHHPLDMTVALTQIRDEKINITFMPPAFIIGLLKNDDLKDKADLSSLRVLGSGSAAIPDWAILEFELKFGVSIINFFGSNEGIGLVSTPEEMPDPLLRATLFPRFGVPGFDWPSVPSTRQMETKLVNLETEKEILEPGIPGELRVKGSTIFSQYFNNPEATRAAFDTDGFYRSGDLFEIAGSNELERYYRFVGRSKEVIIRGGFNIAPAEIDGLLSDHPAISEVAAFGYPDERLGEKIGVAVVPRPNHNVTLSEIIDFLRAKHIAVFKLPEQLMLLDQLPKNGLLKVLRRELSRLYAESIQ